MIHRASLISVLVACLLLHAAEAAPGAEPSLQTLAASLDTASYDPDETIMKLDVDAERIIQFVSRDVGYISYSGSLKGINATLQSLRGNALDQSLLLAYLLGQAGYDSRIARGELADSDRRRLVLGMQRLGPAAHAVDDEAVRNSSTYARYRRALPQLAVVADALPEPASQLAGLLQEAADYYWVQYDIGDGWQDAHPAFADSPAPEVSPSTFYADTIPAELVQTVRFQAFAQRREAGNVQVTPITNAWQRPVGNLQGKVLTFALVPLGLNEETASDLDGHLARSRLFAPMLNGAAAGDWVIDDKGNRIDALAAGSAGAALFKTLRDKTESALVGVAPELAGSFALERIWFELVLSAPGQPDRKLVRTVYDELDDGPILSDDATGLARAPLFVTYNLTFDLGALSPDYLVSRLIDALPVSNAWLHAMLARGVRDQPDAPFPKTDISRAFALMSQQALQNALAQDDVLRYRAEAGVLGLRESYRGEGRFRVSTDIVNNRQRFLRIQDNDIVVDPGAALRHGVWETATEWLPRRLRTSAAPQALNTIDYVEQAQQAHGKLKLVRNDMPGLPVAALGDLRDGYWLVVPDTTDKATPPLAYWRINPDTGETLGMLADGRGSELTEYLAQLVGISMTLVNALSSLAECEQAGGNLAEQACCIMNAHANTAFDMSYGNVVGALFGESAALVDDIARSQTQQGPSVNLMDCGNMQDYGDF